jgi:replication factor C subunit 3/5
MLWVDKHRPLKVDDLSYHSDITARLRALSSNPGTMPHLFFYGPSGSGKKTRIATLLRELYGPGAEKLKLDKRTFTTPTKRVVEINLVTSNYHIELSPGDAGLNDRFVVQEVVKEMASSKNVISAASMAGDASKQPSSMSKSSERADFKVVVLMDCDQLSRQAQAALRRTMEKYASSCRLILCCNSQSKVIEPVRSRCLGIRVAAPSPDEVRSYFERCVYF